MDKTETPILNFYKNANVFITGGTGFMGRILTEKLLRSTEVDTIYLLVREKKRKNLNERIEELLDNELFSKLKEINPNYKSKVKGIAGDCSLPELGISHTDRQILISKINIFFHVAATVNFVESLEIAYNINVNGTRSALNLARQMSLLKSVVHVSTGFSNCPYKTIEEKIYDYPFKYEEVEKKLKQYNEQEIVMLTPSITRLAFVTVFLPAFSTKLNKIFDFYLPENPVIQTINNYSIIGPWPNTYTFTKALAETIIKDIGSGLPIAIFRPTMVVSTYKEPIEGWTDNFYGPTGIYGSFFAGLLRLVICNLEVNADVVPADTCVAGLIGAAWDSSTNFKKSSDVLVYNYASSTNNPMKWNEFTKLVIYYVKKYPLLNTLWAPSLIIVNSSVMFIILNLFLHFIPGAIGDFLLIITGKKPSTDNMFNLCKKLSDKELEIFPMDITSVHWMKYVEIYVKGLRRYLFKEPDGTLERARKRDERMRLFDILIKYLIFCGICYFIFKGISYLLRIR